MVEEGLQPFYDAFICYSSRDRAVAARLQTQIHRTGRMVAGGRQLAIYRDITNLPATPDLWAELCSAMDRSEWLIYLGSHGAADSYWVGREIGYWTASRPERRILVAVLEGTAKWDHPAGRFAESNSSAIHPILAERVQVEPKIVTVERRRPWYGMREQLGPAAVDLVAPILGRPKDELRRIERRRRHRQFLISTTGALVITLSLAGLGWVARSADRAVRDDRTVRRAHALAQQANGVVGSDPTAAAAAAVAGWNLVQDTTTRGALLGVQKSSVSRVVVPSTAGASDFVAGPNHVALVGSGGLSLVTREHPDRPTFVMDGHPTVLFSADGSTLAAVTGTFVRVWRLTPGVSQPVVVGTVPAVAMVGGTAEAASVVAVSRNGKSVVVGHDNGTVSWWDPAAPAAPIRTVRVSTARITALAPSPIGDSLVAGDQRGALLRWPATGATPSKRPLLAGAVGSLSFSRDGTLVLAGSTGTNRNGAGGQVKLFDQADRELWAGWGFSGGSLVLTPNGDTLLYTDQSVGVAVVNWRDDFTTVVSSLSGWGRLATTPDGRAFVYGAQRHEVRAYSIESSIEQRPILFDRSSYFADLVVLADNRTLIASHGGDLEYLDARTRRTIRTVHLDSDDRTGLNDVAVSERSDLVAVAGQTGIYLRRLSSGAEVAFMKYESPVNALAFSPEGNLLASAGGYRTETGRPTVRIWDVNPGTAKKPRVLTESADGRLFEGLPSYGTRIVFGSSTVAVGTWDALSLWRWNDAAGLPPRRTTPVMSAEIGNVSSLALSPDGRLVAAGTVGGQVKVYDSGTGRPVFTFAEHDGAVTDLAFAPAGDLLAGSGTDGKVTLWSLPSGQAWATLLPVYVRTGIQTPVTSLAFLDQGRTLALTSDERTLALWTLDAAKVRRQLCPQLGQQAGC